MSSEDLTPTGTIPAGSPPAVADDKAGAALAIIGSIVGGLMSAVEQAMRDLEELKAELKKHPQIDSSASDDEAMATDADMPES